MINQLTSSTSASFYNTKKTFGQNTPAKTNTVSDNYKKTEITSLQSNSKTKALKISAGVITTLSMLGLSGHAFSKTNKRIAPLFFATGLSIGIAESINAIKKFLKTDKDDEKTNKSKAMLHAGIAIAALGISIKKSRIALNNLGYEVTGLTKEEVAKLGIFKTIKENLKMIPDSISASFKEYKAGNGFALIIRKPKNSNVLKIQEETQKKLGLGQVYFGEEEDYAKWLANKLQEIQEKKIADLKGMNIVYDRQIPHKTAQGYYQSGKNAIYVKKEEFPPCQEQAGEPDWLKYEKTRIRDSLCSQTLFHEIGHSNHDKKAPNIFNLLINQDKERIFPANIPEFVNINGHKVSIKNKMEQTTKEMLDQLVSYNITEDKIVDCNYPKNQYLLELYARTFAAEHCRLPGYHKYTEGIKFPRMMHVLEKDDPKEVMKGMVSIIFDEKTYKEELADKTGLERKAFIDHVLGQIKYDKDK
jgi:hypothetical protein